MSVDEMIDYLKEAINCRTASDIYELPRPEFKKYLDKCGEFDIDIVPYIVLGMLAYERDTLKQKLLRWFR